MSEIILAKGTQVYDYSNCEDEWDYTRIDEYANLMATMILENDAIANKDYMLVMVDCVDWRGRAGYKIVEMSEIDNLWGNINGTNADYTTTIARDFCNGDTELRLSVSSHDVPMGNNTLVKFIDGKDIINMALKSGLSRRDIINICEDTRPDLFNQNYDKRTIKNSDIIELIGYDCDIVNELIHQILSKEQ